MVRASRDPESPTVVGRYRIFGEIASGGMATVHVGRLLGPAAFSRTVAIKRLHAHFAKDPEFVSMLLDEARLAARIVHPNVVSTLDVVVEDTELFLVMDYVVGESLAHLLKRSAGLGQAIPPGVAVSLGMDLLLGLHAAHEAKSDSGMPLHIVHRDVSPQNLLVGADGVGRVVDFGVAKALVRSSTTRDGKIKGKLTYMSPEQIQAGEVDRRSDVFSAGVVLWETLVGRRLFSRPDPGATIAAILSEEVEPPSRLVPQIPEALDAVVMRALDKSASHRFDTAGDMAAALADAHPPAGAIKVAQWVKELAGESLDDRARRVADIESQSSNSIPEVLRPRPAEVATEATAVVPPGATDHTASVPGMAPRPENRSRLWLGAGLVVLVLLLPMTWFLARRSPETAAKADAPPVASATAEATGSPPAASAVTRSDVSATPAPSVAPAATSERSAPKSASPKSKPTARPGKSCDPPYTIDAQGEKVFKPECF